MPFSTISQACFACSLIIKHAVEHLQLQLHVLDSLTSHRARRTSTWQRACRGHSANSLYCPSNHYSNPSCSCSCSTCPAVPPASRHTATSSSRRRVHLASPSLRLADYRSCDLYTLCFAHLFFQHLRFYLSLPVTIHYRCFCIAFTNFQHDSLIVYRSCCSSLLKLKLILQLVLVVKQAVVTFDASAPSSTADTAPISSVVIIIGRVLERRPRAFPRHLFQFAIRIRAVQRPRHAYLT